MTAQGGRRLVAGWQEWQDCQGLALGVTAHRVPFRRLHPVRDTVHALSRKRPTYESNQGAEPLASPAIDGEWDQGGVRGHQYHRGRQPGVQGVF